MEVDSSMSSQFVTALMMVSPLNRNPTILRIVGDRVSEGYLDLTTGVMRRFGAEVTMTVTGYEIANTGYQAADVEIEPDVSAAVYPMVAAAITGGRVEVAGVRETSRQPDIAVADHLGAMGCRIDDGASGIMVEGPASLQPLDADLSALPDGAMALATACLFADGPSRLTGLGTLRHKESDRLQALEDGMERLGARVVVDDESMMITPGPLRAATLDPHGDHRVAMSLALVGLKVVGVEVTDPEVVDKTWPGYWEAMTILQG